MKQQIEEIIKKNLPEKTPFESKLCQNRNGLDYCGTCEQAWEYCSCSARNTGFNQAISQINTSLIADEVLKVVVEKIDSLGKGLPILEGDIWMEGFLGAKNDILELLK